MGTMDDFKKAIADHTMKLNGVDQVDEHRHFDYTTKSGFGGMVWVNRCVVCGVTNHIVVDEWKYYEWRAGQHVQFVWPGWDKDKREMLLNGTHPECWDKIFAEEGDEND